MKPVFTMLLVSIVCLAKAQQGLPKEPFFQLDSIGKSNSCAKYFGKLYYDFLVLIENQLQQSDTSARRLVRKFEKVFAGFFIDACTTCLRGGSVDFEEWRPYFADTSLQQVQYLLLGANAHLNGGLWKAIVTSFTSDEMNQLKKEFIYFKKSLNQTYAHVYEIALSNRRIHRFDEITLGISKWLGNYYLYKWRKRQMRLARLYWENSPQFGVLLGRVQKRKEEIDRKILSQL